MYFFGIYFGNALRLRVYKLLYTKGGIVDSLKLIDLALKQTELELRALKLEDASVVKIADVLERRSTLKDLKIKELEAKINQFKKAG